MALTALLGLPTLTGVGAQVPEGHVSVALRLELNAMTRTLQMEEARAIRDRVAAALKERVGAIVRE